MFSQPVRILREGDEAPAVRKLRRVEICLPRMWKQREDVAGEDVRSPFDLS